MVSIRSLGPFQSPCPYNLKTGLLQKSTIAEEKHCEDSSLNFFFQESEKFPVVRNNNDDNKEEAWNRFTSAYGLRRPGLSPQDTDSAGEAVVEVDLLVDDPKVDFRLLWSLEACKDNLEGAHDSADPSYFGQEYLGP